MSSNSFYKETQEPTNSILKTSNHQNSSQSNYFLARPFDSKTNFSAVTKIDTKFKSEYFSEKNTVINSNNSYAQNVFESMNDVIKNPPDLSSIPAALVTIANSVNATNTISHREKITNLLNRRNTLNNIQVPNASAQPSDPTKKVDLNTNNQNANTNAIKTNNETSKLSDLKKIYMNLKFIANQVY